MSIDTNNSASTRTVVDWDDAPEGATHCVPTSAAKYWFKKIGDKFYAYNGTGWNTNHTSEKCVSMRELTPKPKQPKQLTQAVFNGLSSEYRWAVVDNRGSAYAFNAKPKPFKADFRDWDFNNVDTVFLGSDYDATDWQNSLIERQDVSNRVEQLRSVEEARKHSHYFKDVSGVDAIDLYHVARLYDITDPALFHAFKKIACAGKRGAKDQAQDVQEAIDALKRWQELNK